MKSYRVEVTATACVWQEVFVEAENEDEAMEKALEVASKDNAYPDSSSRWEVNGLLHGQDGHGDLEVTVVERYDFYEGED